MKKLMDNVLRIFLIFFIGSILGFFIEILYGLLMDKVLVFRKGLIYGPFIQVYGVGAVAYYLLINKEKDPIKVFFISMIMGGALEYIFSFLQEVIFGTISWDYTELYMDINGRTSLLYCFFWGVIGVVYLKILFPFVKKIDFLLINKTTRCVTYILFAFMIFDITISCIAGMRQDARKNQIQPRNKIESFIDKHYPDEVMDKVYVNKKEM